MSKFSAITLLLLILFFQLWQTSTVHAQPPQNCECIWQGSFSLIVSKADLIVSGQVVSVKGNSADFSIQKNHFDRALNNKEFNSIIRLWGDNGKLCRPNIEQFPVGSQWLLALNKITTVSAYGFNPNTPNISVGRINDYYLSQCGAYWLPLTEGLISGNLVKGKRWQWDNRKMNPVLLQLVDAYINNIIPEKALIEAAKPQTEAKKLMDKTRSYIGLQQ